MTPNNVSKKMFKKVTEMGMFQKDGARSVLSFAGKMYSFTYWDKPESEFFVRQTYDDTSGVCVMVGSTLHFIDNKKLKFGTVNRISPNGKKAMTSFGNVNHAFSKINIDVIAKKLSN